MSTSRRLDAISSIEADVSSAAPCSASVFSSTCLTLRTICSIEEDTPSTLSCRRTAVSFSSSPEAPSSRIELLLSSTLSFSAALLPADRAPWAVDAVGSPEIGMEGGGRAAK